LTLAIFHHDLRWKSPKPVQFIQPNVLDGACLSVGEHDGFADQFGLSRTVLIQNF
jgi:hypothetical protein